MALLPEFLLLLIGGSAPVPQRSWASPAQTRDFCGGSAPVPRVTFSTPKK